MKRDERQLALPLDFAVAADDSEVEPLPPAAPHDPWVSATQTRNFVMGEPLLDWLDLYGASRGFLKDKDLPGYDWHLDFGAFIQQQGRRFEQAVIALLSAGQPILHIGFDPSMARSPMETLEAMRAGKPLIYQPALRDSGRFIQGIPDLLVRSDVLAKLFPTAISLEEATAPAPAIGASRWHYRVIDIKFRTLELLASGELDNGPSSQAYKVQLFLYNRMLGLAQGYEPPAAYLMGRGWKQRDERGSSCLERLATVSQTGALARKVPISGMADEAVAWVRRVRAEGTSWQVLPTPSVSELYPDAKGDAGAWGKAKKQIAEELGDLTLLWQVREAGRQKGHAAGVFRWTDPKVTPDLLGVSGEKKPDTLMRLLEINQRADGPVIAPPVVRAARDEWHAARPLEFYVDFETVSDLADDFTRMPEKNGQALIFMIGCGHIEDGAWKFACFTTDSLTEPEEERVIDEWLAHMEATRRRLAPAEARPRICHWSHAEESTLAGAFNSARNRHGREDWGDLPWYDFLVKVMRSEPVVVRGALAFGLKAVAKAMHKHGLIDTEWKDGPSDGLGAMVGAWRAQEEAARTGRSLSAIPLMRGIASYNEVDCRVMMEIIRYLRERH